MLHNLYAEMARRDVTAADLARVTGKTERTMRDKIRERYDFTMSELKAVRDTYFPECSIEYLAQTSEEVEDAKS